MSMAALRIARDARGITSTQKLVLYVLADMANADWEAWPSVDALADITGLTDRGVQKALAGLREADLVSVEAGGGRGKTTCYRIQKGEPGSAKGEPHTPNSEAERVNQVPERVNDVPERVNQVHPEAKEASRSKKESGDREASPRSRATRIAAGWWPDEAGMKYAAGLSLPMQATVEKFRDYHAAKGSTMVNWDAAWRTWCRNEIEFAKRRGGPAPGKPRHKTAAELEAELDARCGYDFDAPEPRFVLSEVLN